MERQSGSHKLRQKVMRPALWKCVFLKAEEPNITKKNSIIPMYVSFVKKVLKVCVRVGWMPRAFSLKSVTMSERSLLFHFAIVAKEVPST
jgi:hypothetical protein